MSSKSFGRDVPSSTAFQALGIEHIVGGMVFIGMLLYSTHRSPISNMLPPEHDEKLERELAAELGAR